MKIKFISILFLFNFSFILNTKLYDPQSLFMETVNALGSLSPYNFIYNPNNINPGMGNLNQIKAIQDYLFNFYGVSTFFLLIDDVGSDYLSTNGLTKFITEYMYYYESRFPINDDLTVTVLFLYNSEFGQIQSIRAGNYLTSLLGGNYKLNQLLDEQYVNIETNNYLQAIFSILIKIRNSVELAGQNN
jgi:hypothetical protein